MSFSLLPESALLLASLFLASNKKRSNRTSNCVACHPHCTIWLGAFSYLIKISCRNCSPSITILAVKENKRLTLKRLCGCFCHLCLIWRRKKTMWSHRKAKNGWWSEQKLRITTVPFAYLIALKSHFHFIHTPFDFNQENEKKNCVNSILTWQNGFSVIIHWVWCILLLRVKLSVAFWMLQRGAGICSLLILPVNYHPIHRQFIVGVTDFQQHQAVIRLSTLSYLIILTM